MTNHTSRVKQKPQMSASEECHTKVEAEVKQFLAFPQEYTLPEDVESILHHWVNAKAELASARSLPKGARAALEVQKEFCGTPMSPMQHKEERVKIYSQELAYSLSSYLTQKEVGSVPVAGPGPMSPHEVKECFLDALEQKTDKWVQGIGAASPSFNR